MQYLKIIRIRKRSLLKEIFFASFLAGPDPGWGMVDFVLSDFSILCYLSLGVGDTGLCHGGSEIIFCHVADSSYLCILLSLTINYFNIL